MQCIEYSTTSHSSFESIIHVNLNNKQVLETLQEEALVEIVGLHCHIGSTISDVSCYAEVIKTLIKVADKVKLYHRKSFLFHLKKLCFK